MFEIYRIAGLVLVKSFVFHLGSVIFELSFCYQTLYFLVVIFICPVQS